MYNYNVVLQRTVDKYCVIRENNKDVDDWCPSKLFESMYEAHAYMEQWIINDNQDSIDAYRAKRNNQDAPFDDDQSPEEAAYQAHVAYYNEECLDIPF